jgi:hypothetical protein
MSFDFHTLGTVFTFVSRDIMDVSDQGLRHPAKVARLTQGADTRYELMTFYRVVFK